MNSITSKSHFVSIVLFVLLIASCAGVKKTLRKADAAYAKGEYAVAGELYRKAYPRIPHKSKELRAETAFKQGEAYRHINLPRAEQVYQNAIRNKYPDSTVYLRLAQIQHKNGKYREAIKSYETYATAFPHDTLAMNGLLGAKLADSLRTHPSRYIVKRIKEFNAARSSSFSPAFVGTDGDVLVFTSNRKTNAKEKKPKTNNVSGQPNNHLYTVKKNSKGQWEKPELMEGDVTSINDEGITSFTADGNTMYFTRSMTEENKGQGTFIASSKRSGGSWSAPQAITLFKDSSISVAHPAISPDASMLYFTSDAPGGYGGKDLYRAKLDNEKPSYIENLGPKINTPGDEIFPTFKSDGTLYFSSNGHPGLGGLDIFEVVMNTQSDSTEQWQIVHMGTPINSNADDFGMTFAEKTNSGYFTSGRGENRGADAIWSFLLPELEYFLEGKIIARNGSPLSDARLNIVGDNGENARINTKGDGSYRFKLSVGVNYQLQASANDYLNTRDSLSTHAVSDKESQTFIRNFRLTPTFSSVKIENIYYDFDQATLRPESKEGLDTLIAMMNEHPNITIELSSHTDYKGINDYNRDLSARRAQAVVDYLINAGIDGNRLKAIGYGEVKPFVIDELHAQRHNFLSKGTTLTEKYILTLPEDLQETANQINRRTEFIISSTTYDKK